MYSSSLSRAGELMRGRLGEGSAMVVGDVWV